MSKVGRPRKFKSVEEMATAIEAYFEKCDRRERPVEDHKSGRVTYVPCPMPYTMSGLAETIGMSRRRLLDYNERTDEYGKEFRPTIKAAREHVERNLEERLYDGVGYGPGHIFGLKNNYDWRDTHDHNVKGNVSIHFDKEDKDL